MRYGELLERYSGWVIAAASALTLLLIVPMLALETGVQATGEPAGEVFDLRDDISERFSPPAHGVFFIAESRSGDMLTQGALWELYQNTVEMREADEMGELAPGDLPKQSYLLSGFETRAESPFVGVLSIADAVQNILVKHARRNTTLETATNEQVKLAFYAVVSNPDTRLFRENLSVKARSERRVFGGVEIDYWTSPAFTFQVRADNEKLGGGVLDIGVSGSETTRNKELFNRKVQEVLRGKQREYRLWGIAIDATLEAEEEGRQAGLFITLTLVGALVVVGISLRSYRAVALTGAGLGALIIWLKGISNLIGLPGSLLVDLIVPIAMISLGVDFAIHALRRYDEERGRGYGPGPALRVGFAGVLGALVLAVLSDSVAFLSNTSSSIDSVISFGVSAGIAVVSSFVVLGVVVPLVMMRLDSILPAVPGRTGLVGRLLTVVASATAAAAFAAGYILLIAIDKGIGAGVIVVSALAFVGAPWLFMVVSAARGAPRGSETAPDSGREKMERGSAWLVSAVSWLAGNRIAVVAATAVVTIVALVFALKLDATFDAEDFFDGESDFVVGLDELDEHIAERGGEPGIAYIQGDLTDHRALSDLRGFMDRLPSNPYVAKRTEGSVPLGRTVFTLLERMTSSEYARGQVEAVSSIEIADTDGDGIPDTRAQVKATYGYMVDKGVPLDETTLVYTPGQVRATLFHDPTGSEENVTTLEIGIPGTRQQETTIAARDSLQKELKVLEDSPAITLARLTGSPFIRLATLDATTRALQVSLIIALAATMVLLVLAMRSLRYAIATVIPVVLVVVWLYALMYATGFALNFVTATIGAVSVGVGIDFSIHMTVRFREELGKVGERMQALRQAANGTGVALLASAASSIVGFAILGFAPMPLFASYGMLTATMIFLALAASLLVLPSLLLLVTGEKSVEAAPTRARHGD